MVTISWHESFRIIFSRFPFVGIFDFIADPSDLELIEALERRTNDRVQDELGNIALVRREDRIAGPGTTPIMAAFTHARPSRFSDGSYGTYYAGAELAVSLAESRFHTEQFYRATNEPSADIDLRVYCARIDGKFQGLLSASRNDARLDPDSYSESQAYAKELYDANVADGIIYPSVRDAQHRAAVACFRPRTISECYTSSYLLYRWDSVANGIVDVIVRESLTN